MQELHEYSYNNQFLNSISEKVESRIKDLHYTRQMIIGINSIEEFILSKIKLSQFCFDIEDDFREILQKYKSLFISCKELQEKNHLLVNTIRSFEFKNLNLEKIQADFKQSINDLVAQTGFLKEKLIKNEDYTGYLEQKLLLCEGKMERRNINNSMSDLGYRERNLNDLNYADKIDYGNEGCYGSDLIRNNCNNNYQVNNYRRNLNYKISSNNSNFHQIDNDLSLVKNMNKGNIVESVLSKCGKKESIDAEKSSIDRFRAANNLNSDNHCNNAVQVNRTEANINNINNNNIGKILNFENSENNIIIPLSKTIDYEENHKVNK